MDIKSVTLQLDDQPMDCAFSDAHQHLATGIVDGTLRLYTYSFADGSTGALSSDLRSTLRLSEASCRAVGFSADGSSIVAGYEDGLLALSSVETSQPILRLPDAHEAPISTLRVLDDNLMAVGDEAGCIQLWDLRSKAAVYTYSEHTDFITDFTVHQKDNCLVATSGDGTLSIHDLSKRKVRARSEDDADDELLSAVVCKKGKKVVAGTQSGVIMLYSWGYFNDCSDRFPGHPESVDAIVKFDEDTVITGSSDGVVRILNVLPNKLLGVVGEHVDMPIEKLALSREGLGPRVLASASHDNSIKLWDLRPLTEEDDEEGEGQGEEEEAVAAGADSDEEAAVVGSDVDSDADSEEDGEEGSEEGSEFDEDEDEDGELEEGSSGDEGAAASGSDGEGDAEEEGAAGAGPGSSAAAAAQQQQAGRKRGGARDAAGQQQEGKQGKAGGSKQQAAAAAADDDDDGGDDDDADSDAGGDSDSDSDSDGGQKKKRQKRERTKWNPSKAKPDKTGNFFADLL